MQYSFADEKANLSFRSHGVQSQAFASILGHLKNAFEKDDQKYKEAILQCLWDCLNKYDSTVANWAYKAILSLVATDKISPESAFSECMIRVKSEYNNAEITLRLAFTVATDLSRGLSMILQENPYMADMIVQLLKEEDILSHIGVIFSLLVKSDLPDQYKILLAQHVLDKKPEMLEQSLDALGKSFPCYMILNAPTSKMKTSFLLENYEKLTPSQLESLILDDSHLLLLARIVRSCPDIIKSANVTPHPVLLPAILATFSSETQIEKAMPLFDTEVMAKSRSLIGAITVIKDPSKVVGKLPMDVADMTTFDFLQWIGEDEDVLFQYIRHWLSFPSEHLEPSEESIDFIVGSFNLSRPDNLLQSFKLLAKCCWFQEHLAGDLVLLYLNFFAARSFPVSKPQILKELGAICGHRHVTKSVVKFLLSLTAKAGDMRVLACEVIEKIYQSNRANIFEQIKTLTNVSPSEDLEWSKCKLRLIRSICEMGPSKELIEKVNDLVMKPTKFQPEVLDIFQTLCEDQYMFVSKLHPVTRSKSKQPGDERSLACHARIISLAATTESEDLADTLLAELWQLSSHTSYLVRGAAFEGMSQYEEVQISKFFNSRHEDPNAQNPNIQKDKLCDNILQRLETIYENDERNGFIKFLHKMTRSSLEALSRTLYTKQYTVGDDTFDSVIASLFEVMQNETATSDFVALSPAILNGMPEAKRATEAMKILSKSLPQVPVVSINYELEKPNLQYQRYFASWRLCIESVFSAVANSRREQNAEGSVFVWTRDKLCEVMRQSLVQCESALSNVIITITYLALYLNGKQDAISSQYEIPYSSWLTSVVAFLLNVANPSHSNKTPMIFQCEIARTLESRLLSSLCLRILTSHISRDDLSFFDLPIKSEIPAPLMDSHIGKWAKHLVSLNEKDSISRIVHELMAGKHLSPTDLKEYDRLELASLGGSLGCDRSYIGMLSVFQEPSSAAAAEEVTKLAEMAEWPEDIEKLMDLFSNLDDKALSDERNRVKKRIEKLNKSKDEYVKRSIWRGLATYQISLCGRNISNLPRDYSKLPEGNFIRAIEARIRTTTPTGRIVLLSALVDQERTDSRHLPPIDLSFLFQYANEGAEVRELMWKLAVQQEDVKLLSYMSTEKSLSDYGAPLVPVICSTLSTVLLHLTPSNVTALIHFIMESLSGGNGTWVNSKSLAHVAGQIGNPAVLSVYYSFMPTPSNTLEFSHLLWRLIEPVGCKIKFFTENKSRLICMWAEASSGPGLNMVKVIDLLNQCEEDSERDSLSCIFGAFAQKLNENDRMTKCMNTMTLAKLLAAHGTTNLLSYWRCILCLTVGARAPVPFSFVSKDDTTTVLVATRRLSYYLEAMIGRKAAENMVFFVCSDKTVKFLLSALKWLNGDDEKCAKKYIRLLVGYYPRKISPILDEENAWDKVFS